MKKWTVTKDHSGKKWDCFRRCNVTKAVVYGILLYSWLGL